MPDVRLRAERSVNGYAFGRRRDSVPFRGLEAPYALDDSVALYRKAHRKALPHSVRLE